MKIGIVSDTHGRVDRLDEAIGLLRDRGAQVIVHCGDIDSPACLEAMGTSGMRAYAVAGNVDRFNDDLVQEARIWGVSFSTQSLRLSDETGKTLAVCHGHEEAVLAALLTEDIAYLCHGHTHRQKDQRVGSVRVINPGALFNCRSPAYPTVALLDTASDTLEFIRVP